MKTVYGVICAACVSSLAWGQAPETQGENPAAEVAKPETAEAAVQPKAAPKKLLTIQIANLDAIVKASAKVGEFVGNPTLGAMASAAIRRPCGSMVQMVAMLCSFDISGSLRMNGKRYAQNDSRIPLETQARN